MALRFLDSAALALLDEGRLDSFPDIPVMVHDIDVSEPVPRGAETRFEPFEGGPVEGFWYVSDIHLEFFLERVCQGRPVSPALASDVVDLVLYELLWDVPEEGIGQPLLIAGDTSHARPLNRIFLHRLRKLWKGPVVAILGNHELWNGHPEDWAGEHLRNLWRSQAGLEGGYEAPPVEEVFARYRWDAFQEGAFLLEGDLLAVRGGVWTFHSRSGLEDMDDGELGALLASSDLVVFGGVGFAGLEDLFNYRSGIYRSALASLEEEASLSRWFARLHDRLVRVGGRPGAPGRQGRVVVLTHMAFSSWTRGRLGAGWVYISGHTHENGTSRKDGALDIHDNQVGYENTQPRLMWLPLEMLA